MLFISNAEPRKTTRCGSTSAKKMRLRLRYAVLVKTFCVMLAAISLRYLFRSKIWFWQNVVAPPAPARNTG
jgi:hypothetical protein